MKINWSKVKVAVSILYLLLVSLSSGALMIIELLRPFIDTPITSEVIVAIMVILSYALSALMLFACIKSCLDYER